jgi:predicted GNAT family acetyltransferase
MANLLDLSPDEFMFTLQEFGYSPERRDELIRQYREHNSVFGALNRAAQERQAEIAGEGRRPVAGGFLSKPEGSLGMDAVRGLRVEPMAGLLGMLTGAGRAVEAPAAAYQGLIPMGDVPLEALGTAGMASLGGAAMTRPAGSVGMGGRVAATDFNVTRRDASNIFGEGTERVRYTDPNSGGTMEVVVRPDGRASVLELEVPESFRGQGIGQSLQSRVMQDFPVMGGQVSSRAAATTAYRLGRRPFGQPDATLEDVFRAIDEDSSVNLISPQAQPTTFAANRDQTVGLLSTAAAAEPRNAAERMARDILDMRAAGRAGEVTDDMMAQADPQYMYNNTPLPMDEASRMARARAAGFDVENSLTHGSKRDIYGFSLNAPKSTDFGWYGQGVSLAPNNPSMSDAYAMVEKEGMGQWGGRTYPVMSRGRMYEWPEFNPPATSLEQSQELTQSLRGLGYEGANAYAPNDSDIWGEAAGSWREQTVYDPRNIRSRFARFDPEFSHLSNLNAANIDPLAGLFGVLAAEEQRRQRNGQ